MAFWQEVERRRAKDQSVTVIVALWFTVSACCPFSSGHRKSNTIYYLVACDTSAPMSFGFFFIEREKGKQQLSCHV